MKIQPIQFSLEIGIADELRVIVNENVAYYNLVDTNKETIMPNGRKFEFKVLYSSTLILNEDQVADVEKATDAVVKLLGVTLIE